MKLITIQNWFCSLNICLKPNFLYKECHVEKSAKTQDLIFKFANASLQKSKVFVRQCPFFQAYITTFLVFKDAEMSV